jgi:hypothetical protein
MRSVLRTRGDSLKTHPRPAAGSGAPESPGWALPLLVAAMDAAWIVPYATLAGTIWLGAASSLLAPVTVFALLAGGQIATRAGVSGFSQTRATQGRVALVVAGAAAGALAVVWQYRADPAWRLHGPARDWLTPILTGARPELPAWVLALLVWRRALVIGRTALEYYDVETVFTLGLAAFGVFAALMAAAHTVPPLAAAAAAGFPYLLGFFLVSLIALPVARLQSVQRQTRASQRNATVAADWYALVVGAAVAVLAVATVAGAILRLDAAAVFRAAVPALDAVLLALLYVIAVPIGFVLSGMVWAIRRMLHPHAVQPMPSPSPAAWLQQLSSGHTAGLPPEAAAALRWGAALALLAIVLLVIARSVFRYERVGRRHPADIMRESVWSWADLRASWHDLFRRRARSTASAGQNFGNGAAAAIRRAYAEFLGLAAALGARRHESQTPVEFAHVVSSNRPAATAAIETLTDLYGRVRYGLEAPSSREVAAAQDALERVRAAILPEGAPDPRRARGRRG